MSNPSSREILLNVIHQTPLALLLDPQKLRLLTQILDGDGVEEFPQPFPRLLPDEPGHALRDTVTILSRLFRVNAENRLQSAFCHPYDLAHLDISRAFG